MCGALNDLRTFLEQTCAHDVVMDTRMLFYDSVPQDEPQDVISVKIEKIHD